MVGAVSRTLFSHLSQYGQAENFPNLQVLGFFVVVVVLLTGSFLIFSLLSHFIISSKEKPGCTFITLIKISLVKCPCSLFTSSALHPAQAHNSTRFSAALQ